MFTIYEIERENQRSVFPRLFFFLAKNIVATCGRGGEGAVREAVRNLGAKCGKELREAHREQKKDTLPAVTNLNLEGNPRTKHLLIGTEIVRPSPGIKTQKSRCGRGISGSPSHEKLSILFHRRFLEARE